MTLIDNGVYVGGKRTDSPANLDETYGLMRQRGGMAWIGFYRPAEEDVLSVQREFGLHELAIEDALSGHQRAKLERYGETLFVVLRPARYLDEVEMVEFGELHVFVGPDFVVTVRHAESPDLAQVRKRMEQSPELLALGPQAVLYAILDQVVDEYAPVVAGLENDIDEIEDELFRGDPEVSRRIYQLHREVLAFQRATQPLDDMLAALERGAEKYHVPLELQRRLRDVHDHVLRVADRANAFRALLQNALTVNATLVAQRQNEDMKRISSWAAILFAPTLVGAVYGMNFREMPELRWAWGYPLALAMMVAIAVGLYVAFKRNKWL
ncbi:magnesium/cobalt transporter CorA [Arthrobacter sp. GCM10027362]|uniref:magnesium/cobalt transporter CorA n=1 Tax=Arthrobacter sp. GCM10027362 TaxID=3273379 RepID=UPI00363A80E4